MQNVIIVITNFILIPGYLLKVQVLTGLLKVLQNSKLYKIRYSNRIIIFLDNF